jgi:hypothetical protein
VTVLEETFDALPMDSALGPPWVVSGGDSAQVVPLPTSVDRSIRIRSSADGGSAAACRATTTDPGRPLRAGFELLIERAPTTAAPVFTVEGGGGRLLAIGIGPSGALVDLQQPSADGSPLPPGSSPAPGTSTPPEGGGRGDGEWRRIQAGIDPAQGSATWQAHDAAGVEVAGGTLTIDPGSVVDQLCFFSPQGVPSGWIAVDDLIIRG